MTREIRQISEKVNEVTKENLEKKCNVTGSSVYAMGAVAACLVFCVGIVVYAIIGA